MERRRRKLRFIVASHVSRKAKVGMGVLVGEGLLANPERAAG